MIEPIVIWDLEDDPDGNYVHIVVEHDISQAMSRMSSASRAIPRCPARSSGRPLTFGWTSTGRYIDVVWEHVDDDPARSSP